MKEQKTMKIVLLTGGELRHSFFRMALARRISVTSYSEATGMKFAEEGLRKKHKEAREQSEKDFFAAFVQGVEDLSHPTFLLKGEINDPKYVDEIIRENPDVIVSYGCSIIKPPLIDAFKDRFINIHLGLSPYYRGAGTNYWPLVNGTPELVGATFMHIDEGVDTGEIIHQVRAQVVWGDTPHTIGNRLIKDLVPVCAKIVNTFPCPRIEQPKPLETTAWKQKDYTEESVKKLYENFAAGMVDKYLEEKAMRDSKYPIIENPCVS